MSEQNSRRDFLQTAAGLTVGSGAGVNAAGLAPDSFSGELEWRNKQPGMHYRRLGRTGLMISEVVSGGDPISSGNYEHLNLALEMGLNYLDMAPAYGNGDCEIAYGKFLGGSAKRDKVFLQTKVSAYGGLRNRSYTSKSLTVFRAKSRAPSWRVSRKSDVEPGGEARLLSDLLSWAAQSIRRQLSEQRHVARIWKAGREPAGTAPVHYRLFGRQP